MHSLDIDIDDSNLNTKVFKISDNSVWDKNILIRNAILEITNPAATYMAVFNVKKDFKLVLNANLLHLNSAGLTPVPSLPDGLYNIKFSVDPNVSVFVNYYYFRNTKQLNEYFCLLTSLLKERGRLTRKEYLKKKELLLWYKELIDGAKFLAEDKHDVCAANEVYKEVKELLSKFSITC